MSEQTIKVNKNNPEGLGSKIIQEIIKDNGIDMEIYYVDSFKVKKGSWDTSAIKRDQNLTWEITRNEEGRPMGQFMEGKSIRHPEFMVNENKTNYIEVTFKRRPIEVDIVKSFERIIKDMPTFPYKRRKPIFEPGSGNAFELSTFDAHLGKLAAEIETGYRNYDLKIAEDDYKYVSDELIAQAIPYKPEKCFMPIGQDIYHIDNMDSKTTHGTHTMDVDGRITKVNDVVFRVTLRTILKLRELAPVKVIWSPGNHDHFASYMLCFALQQYFRNDPMVEVDTSLPSVGKQIHKVELWGKTLVGFTHRIVGRHNVWANELAQAFPELWGKSIFREWHHGDQHKKKVLKVTPVETMGGVVLRQLTALSPVDKWHTENLFTDAVPGGEGFIWNKEKGVTTNFMAWTGQYDKYRKQLIKNK